MTSGDDQGYARLTRQLSQRRLLALEAYKDRCLRRRIAVRMRACGVHTYADYLGLLERTPEEYERLMDALTINVTKFFRNRETWDRLALELVPALVGERRGLVRAWSAGCASGEEAYTIAMVLAEAAESLGHPRWLDRIVVDATDVDRPSLERARAALYPGEAFAEAPEGAWRRWCDPEGGAYRVAEPLRSRVRCHRLDINRDPPPAERYDLVACRNLVIYFDRPTQERLFARFADLLTPGGLLVLGKVETLVGAARQRLEVVDARERIYRRPR